jgi:hypothetical protein
MVKHQFIKAQTGKPDSVVSRTSPLASRLKITQSADFPGHVEERIARNIDESRS